VNALARARVAGDSLADEHPARVELESKICRRHSVEPVTDLTRSQHDARGRLVLEFALSAPDRGDGRRGWRTGAYREYLGRTGNPIVSRRASRSTIAPPFPVKRAPMPGIDHASGKEEQLRQACGSREQPGNLNDGGVLEEERTLFRIEQLESLIHGDLRLIRFNLAEIRLTATSRLSAFRITNLLSKTEPAVGCGHDRSRLGLSRKRACVTAVYGITSVFMARRDVLQPFNHGELLREYLPRGA